MPDVTILLIKPESVMLFFTVQYNEDIRKNRLSPESSPGQLLHEHRTGQVQKKVECYSENNLQFSLLHLQL